MKNNLPFHQPLPSCVYIITPLCSYLSIKDLFVVVAFEVVVCDSAHTFAQISICVNIHYDESSLKPLPSAAPTLDGPSLRFTNSLLLPCMVKILRLWICRTSLFCPRSLQMGKMFGGGTT